MGPPCWQAGDWVPPGPWEDCPRLGFLDLADDGSLGVGGREVVMVDECLTKPTLQGVAQHSGCTTFPADPGDFDSGHSLLQ